jgi:hypothetical protein
MKIPAIEATEILTNRKLPAVASIFRLRKKEEEITPVDKDIKIGILCHQGTPESDKDKDPNNQIAE